MKKVVSILLTVCMLLSLGVMLTACNSHTHSYQTEWSKDDTHHWHACDGEDCPEVADKAEHSWDDGKITTEATADADGVKTYTCTVCGETKTESVKYDPKTTVTEAEWKAALAPELFDNVTLTYSMYIYDEETKQSSCQDTSIIEYDGDLRKSNDRVTSNSGDMDSAELATIVGMALEEYSNATYDEETKQYTTLHYYESLEMNLGLVLRFENGKLVRFEYHFLSDGSLNTLYKLQWFVCEFSSYGTTEVVSEAE